MYSASILVYYSFMSIYALIIINTTSTYTILSLLYYKIHNTKGKAITAFIFDVNSSRKRWGQYSF